MFENNPIKESSPKKAVLATALAAAIGYTAPVTSDQISGNFSGLFTLVTPTGVANFNTDADFRTPVSGTFNYDIATGLGTMAIAPFSFFW